MHNTDWVQTVRHSLAGGRAFVLLLCVLVVLVIGDGLVSHFVVTGRLGHEGNPLLQMWVGGEAFLVVKAIGALVCAFLLWDMYRRWSGLAVASTWAFVLAYAGIVAWNLAVLLGA